MDTNAVSLFQAYALQHSFLLPSLRPFQISCSARRPFSDAVPGSWQQGPYWRPLADGPYKRGNYQAALAFTPEEIRKNNCGLPDPYNHLEGPIQPVRRWSQASLLFPTSWTSPALDLSWSTNIQHQRLETYRFDWSRRTPKLPPL
ncbi:hypothetical protein PoB_007486000 [Plakobranchus ocellatus]|uniref:Uncharacterized protein n=1 Tax=Plakobranchus ocellatus TaxID=259542 RepID=A0AAV4DW17_9GAST|nr:hypothetical protein PoB_007486000 [Plakobranchus ocellatus]